ncbi:MAG TPA: cytochrome c [Sphingomicrobium sp.]|nr:cytochrome c [Sphingomicrobium sp.]
MIRLLTAAAIIAVPVATAIAQPEEGPSRWKANTARHQKVLMYGVPEPYAAVRDPSPDNPAKLLRGRDLFDRNCASCHGWSGQGTGPEGFYLVPAPADLEWLGHAPQDRADPYIYWAIAEGGKQFDSEMPAYKYNLTVEDRWALTAFIRNGMPHKSP